VNRAGGISRHKATGTPNLARHGDFAERAKKAAALMAVSDGSLSRVFETGGFALGDEEALRVNLQGGTEQGGK
jgi:hypothetical protein